jgi:hypothetical protein
MNELFTFNIDVVLFHLFIGILIYFNVLSLGISCLRIFKENLNPVLIYPSGLFIFCLLSFIFWNFNFNLLIFLFFSIIIIIVNFKCLYKYHNNIFDIFILFTLICFLAVVNSTTLHDPDSQNNAHAFVDTYFYISLIQSDINFLKLKDLTIYGFEKDLRQQIGILLAYPFRNFELFRPILHFSISLWILCLMFAADIIRKNIKIEFVSYQTLIFTFLIYFSFRSNFYLDESLPTILTIPLIFLLSFFTFENFKKDKLIFEIFLAITTIILCLLTKQILLLVTLPLLFYRGVMSGEKKIIVTYLVIFFIAIISILFLHKEHYESSFSQFSLSMPSFFYATNSLGLHVLNRSAQLLSLILIVLLTYKNIKILIFTILSVLLYYCTSVGGPYFFWLMLFVIYSINKYTKTNFLNSRINTKTLIFILFFIFTTAYYFFQTYHLKLGTYFLFFLFFFIAFNITKFSNNLKIGVLILAIFFPFSFSLIGTSKINFIIQEPLQSGKSLVFLNNKIKQIVPENSIIFTDIAVKNYRKDFDHGIYYLTQSKRQFYALFSTFLYDKPKSIEKFNKMLDHNHDIIYKNKDPRKIITNNYFKKYFILTKKENLNNILRIKKNINIIDDSYALIEIIDNT